MINFAAPSLLTKEWPAVLIPFRILSLILLAILRMLHVTHGTLITLLYHMIDSLRLRPLQLQHPQDTAVFITGCASGFGYSLALRLDHMGYTVFAGVRVLDHRAEKLKASASDRLHVVPCNVTDPQQIQEACDYVRDHLKDTRLRAVVNNAGVIDVMPFEWKKDPGAEVRVNLMAPMDISRIFLPLLRQTPGSRLIFVSSLAGKQAWTNRELTKLLEDNLANDMDVRLILFSLSARFAVCLSPLIRRCGIRASLRTWVGLPRRWSLFCVC